MGRRRDNPAQVTRIYVLYHLLLSLSWCSHKAVIKTDQSADNTTKEAVPRDSDRHPSQDASVGEDEEVSDDDMERKGRKKNDVHMVVYFAADPPKDEGWSEENKENVKAK